MCQNNFKLLNLNKANLLKYIHFKIDKNVNWNEGPTRRK